MTSRPNTRVRRIGRRAWLADSTLILAAACGLGRLPADLLAGEADGPRPLLRLGLVTDLHYADREPRGSRHYRESLAKAAEAAEHFRTAGAERIIELGDIIDTAPSLDAEREGLRRIAAELSRSTLPCHYVLGNHCVSALPKPDFLRVVGAPRTFYSFDAQGVHLVVLDACFRGDGTPYGGVPFDWKDANIPPDQVRWLREDLQRTDRKCLVFVHQCLDVPAPYGVRNAAEVRSVLEESRKVLAVLQGHHHRGNYQYLGGIHYCTLSALVEGSGPENSAYAVLDVLPGHVLRLTGLRRQKSYRWEA